MRVCSRVKNNFFKIAGTIVLTPMVKRATFNPLLHMSWYSMVAIPLG